MRDDGERAPLRNFFGDAHNRADKGSKEMGTDKPVPNRPRFASRPRDQKKKRMGT
jgi:hypothetical protein